MTKLFDLKAQAISLQEIMVALRPNAKALAITKEYNKLSEVLQAWYKTLEEDDDHDKLNPDDWKPFS